MIRSLAGWARCSGRTGRMTAEGLAAERGERGFSKMNTSRLQRIANPKRKSTRLWGLVVSDGTVYLVTTAGERGLSASEVFEEAYGMSLPCPKSDPLREASQDRHIREMMCQVAGQLKIETTYSGRGEL